MSSSRTAKILVVDDAPTIRRFLELLLRERGYEVDLAESAEQALVALQSQDYDLILVDKNLEGQDGFAVCRAARARSSAACMLMTADTSVDSAVRAVEEEIAAYLLKPLRRDPVLSKVAQALERVRLLRESAEARAELQAAKEALERRTTELERTLKELVQTQHRLTESEKLISMGMLAAGVAHEINNPACFVLPNLEYLQRAARAMAEQALQAGAPAQEVQRELAHTERMLERCSEGIQRIVGVVGTLQLFSRRDHSGGTGHVDLNALCRSLLDLVAHELGGRAELQLDLQPVAQVVGSEQHLAQAVLDLLLNARRAVLAADTPGPHRIRLRTSMADGQVLLAVEDTGPPLAEPAATARALEPFFGSGGLAGGPGLHLSLARDVIDRHGGELRLYCSERGNCLEAVLPSAP